MKSLDWYKYKLQLYIPMSDLIFCVSNFKICTYLREYYSEMRDINEIVKIGIVQLQITIVHSYIRRSNSD